MKKYISVEVDIFGTKQKVMLPLVKQKSPFGEYYLIDAREKSLPLKEMIKIAKETGYPVIDGKNQKYFPPNKTLREIAKKNKR